MACSIPSTDDRNDRVTVKISKLTYLRKYCDIENKTVELDEKKNKRGRTNFLAHRMIMTETVCSIQRKLEAEGIKVSTGSILNLRPFFVTYATEKEMSLCLCKICLNVKFLFNTLMTRAKKDGDVTFESVSAFFMYDCYCAKSANGYYQWNCATRRCKNCKNSKPAPLKCQTSNDLVTTDQFEVVKKDYIKVNNEGIAEKKTTKLTERVSQQITYEQHYKKLCKLGTTYATHKYHMCTMMCIIGRSY